jgi:hypothetical protein
MANTPQPPMEIGRLWHCGEYDGAEGWTSGVFNYPGGVNTDQTPDPSNYIKRQWLSQCQKLGTYMWSTNWTDPEGTTWPVASSYFFRSMNYNYPLAYTSTDGGGNMNYLYAGGVQEYYRYSRPWIKVATDAGVVSPPFFLTPDSAVVLPDNAGSGHRPPPIVDPNLVSEMSVHMWWRYIMGVQYNRDEYVYPQGTAHQDYVLQEIHLVNNGISGVTGQDPNAAGTDDPVLTGQTVNNMVWAQNMDYRNVFAGGPQTGQDNEAEYVQPWGPSGHGAMMFYDTDSPDIPGADWGDPVDNTVYDNMLVGNCYAMYGCIFASTGPGADYGTDDAAQPAYRAFWWERGFDYAGADYSPANPPAGIQDQRDDMTAGALQIDYNEQYTDNPVYTGIQDVVNGPGPTGIMGYGPVNATPLSAANSNSEGWTIPFGDSVKIVQVLAGGAIDKEEGRRIGTTWAAQKAASADPSTFMSAADIALVKTGADTTKKAANMAYWNYYGQFPADVTADTLAKWGVSGYAMSKPSAYDQPYNAPDAPRPPGWIYVKGNGTDGIEIYFGKEAETANNFDLGTNVFAGYRVYRQDGDLNQPMHLIKEGPASDFTDFAGSGDIPAGREWVDNTVTPGVSYWYSVTAYDDGTANWAYSSGTHVMESSPWWTWTGFWLTGVQVANTAVTQKVQPGRFSLSQNAPNPFNPSTSINYSTTTAGNVQLNVYDLNGRLVRTLVNGNVASGVHEVAWDGRDAVGRQVASGVYVYRLTAPNGQLTRRMTLVR